MGLRQALFGLGLSGIISNSAIAQEPDTDYVAMTHPEVRKALYDKASRVSFDTWEPQVLDYDGAMIVLFNSSCNQTEQADLVDRYQEIAYMAWIDAFSNEKVNDLPIRFSVYDVCGKSKNEFLGVTGPWPRTNMYLDGKLIDSKVGGPTSEEKIPNTIVAGTKWIESNILGIPYVKNGQDMKVIYNGTTNTILEPY